MTLWKFFIICWAKCLRWFEIYALFELNAIFVKINVTQRYKFILWLEKFYFYQIWVLQGTFYEKQILLLSSLDDHVISTHHILIVLEIFLYSQVILKQRVLYKIYSNFRTCYKFRMSNIALINYIHWWYIDKTGFEVVRINST